MHKASLFIVYSQVVAKSECQKQHIFYKKMSVDRTAPHTVTGFVRNFDSSLNGNQLTLFKLWFNVLHLHSYGWSTFVIERRCSHFLCYWRFSWVHLAVWKLLKAKRCSEGSECLTRSSRFTQDFFATVSKVCRVGWEGSEDMCQRGLVVPVLVYFLTSSALRSLYFSLC